MMTRQELQNIRQSALHEASCPGLNEQWKRAYESLADAADRLDAMVCRTEVPSYIQNQPPCVTIGSKPEFPPNILIREGSMFPTSIQEEVS